jgi:O-Antigen ligase
MLDRLRANLWVSVALTAMMLVEVLALRSDSFGTIIVLVLCGLLAILVLTRSDMKKIAMGAALACAFTLTWNGWFVGPLRPGDALILLTILLLLIANPNDGFRTPPWWLKQLPVAIVLVALLAILIPTDPIYLANRIVLDAQGRLTVDTKGSFAMANIGVAFKFIVAVFAIPMAFIGAVRIDKRAARWLGMSFALGAAASGWVATLDHFGTDLGRYITKVPNVGNRQLGFTTHPNFLAAGMVIAIPFAFWLAASTVRHERLIGFACLIGSIGGVYASGSRGGAVCAVGVVGLCILVHPRTRVHSASYAVAGVAVLLLLAVVFPSVGAEILRVTRLASNSNTGGSDTVRQLVGDQGIRDWHFSPIKGIGLQAYFDASEVYLQELAAGGLILFFAMQVYMCGGIYTAWRYLKRDNLAMACGCALVGALALNLFEADLTDRFYYVPAAILLALVHSLDGDDTESADTDAVDPGFTRADGLPRRKAVLSRGRAS